MTRTETITMTMKEADRLKTIQAVIDGDLTARLAANRLRLTKRQVNRLVMRFREDGAAGLVSRQRGRPSHRQLPSGVAEMALALIRERYADFGPTSGCKKLRDFHHGGSRCLGALLLHCQLQPALCQAAEKLLGCPSFVQE